MSRPNRTPGQNEQELRSPAPSSAHSVQTALPLHLFLAAVWLGSPALALAPVNVDPPLESWGGRCFLAGALLIPAALCGLLTLFGVVAVTSARHLAFACVIVLFSALVPIAIGEMLAAPMILIPITGPFLYLLLIGALSLCIYALGLLLLIQLSRKSRLTR